MRIVHCLRAPVGGLFRHVLDLAGAQADLGHNIGIIADSNTEDRLTGPKFAALAPKMKLGITRIAMSRQPGIGDFNAYRAVAGHVSALEPDVLHGHGAKGGAYARLSARQLRRSGQSVKAFYTPHGGSLNFKPTSLDGIIFLRLERILERYTTGLIFESQYAADVYHARISRNTVPFRVIHNGLQPSDFALGIHHGEATDILYVGELRFLKGVDVLLEAIAALRKRRPITATIVGAGPDAEALKAKAAVLGLDNAVSFTGALPVREAFAKGRIMVVPSRAESFPYIVLEAAAAGLPLISTSVGGIPEIVSGTDTELIPPDNVVALVAALDEALTHPDIATEKAKKLRQAVKARFTVDLMTHTILSFYGLTSE